MFWRYFAIFNTQLYFYMFFLDEMDMDSCRCELHKLLVSNVADSVLIVLKVALVEGNQEPIHWLISWTDKAGQNLQYDIMQKRQNNNEVLVISQFRYFLQIG